MGDLYFDIKENIDSEQCYLKAINIFKDIRDKMYNTNVADVYYKLSKLYFYNIKDYEKSTKYLDQALEIYEEKKYQENKVEIADCYFLYAEIHVASMSHPRWYILADGCYNRALETYINIENKVKIANCHIRLANLYAVDKENKLARDNILKAKKYYNEIYGDKNFNLIEFYHVYAEVEYELKNYEDAINISNSALDIYIWLEIEHPIYAKINADLSKYYYYCGEYGLSRNYANKVIESYILEYEEKIIYEYITALQYMILSELELPEIIDEFTEPQIDRLVKALDYSKNEKDDLFSYCVLMAACESMERYDQVKEYSSSALDIAVKYYNKDSKEYRQAKYYHDNYSAEKLDDY